MLKSRQPGYRTSIEKERRRRNPEKVRAEANAYYAKSENRKRRQEQQRKYWHTNPDAKYKNNEYKKAYNKRHRAKDPVQYLIYTSRSRAKFKGLEHSITKQDLTIPTHCPVLGIELDYGPNATGRGRKHLDNCPSLDRINSSKGYVPGNVQIISWRANKLKQDATKEELVALYEYYIQGNLL